MDIGEDIGIGQHIGSWFYTRLVQLWPTQPVPMAGRGMLGSVLKATVILSAAFWSFEASG